jgi:hypothetical protein
MPCRFPAVFVVHDHVKERIVGSLRYRAASDVIGMVLAAADPREYPSIRIRKRHGWKVAAAGSSACIS